MRVVVPYARNVGNGAPGLYPAVRAALEADGVTAEYIDVSGSRTAYHELFLRLWAEGSGFVNVEHDIVVRSGALSELWACAEPWCGFVYALSVGYDAYLGCAKFSDELVAGHPTVVAEIDQLPQLGMAREWGRLDTRLKQVLEDHYGLRIHKHWPPLEHLNPTQRIPIYNCRVGHAIPDEVVRQGPPPYACPACAAT